MFLITILYYNIFYFAAKVQQIFDICKYFSKILQNHRIFSDVWKRHAGCSIVDFNFHAIKIRYVTQKAVVRNTPTSKHLHFDNFGCNFAPSNEKSTKL